MGRCRVVGKSELHFVRVAIVNARHFMLRVHSFSWNIGSQGFKKRMKAATIEHMLAIAFALVIPLRVIAKCQLNTNFMCLLEVDTHLIQSRSPLSLPE